MQNHFPNVIDGEVPDDVETEAPSLQLDEDSALVDVESYARTFTIMVRNSLETPLKRGSSDITAGA